MKKASLTTILAFAAILAAPSTSKAVVLDWDSVTWAPDGSLVQSYDIDPGFAGNDIRVTVSGDTGYLFTNSPRIGPDLTGGNIPAQNGLIINTNHAGTSTFVTITIEFFNPAGVLNPTFSLFDIDVGGPSGAEFTWVDQIRNIQASFGATNYTPTFSGLGAGVVSSPSTLIGTTFVDNTSGDGNATITFGGGPVTRIQFDYGPGPGSIANPDGQVIGISDISFNDMSAVPEIDSVWVALGALVIAAAFQGLRRRKAADAEFLPTPQS